MPAARQGIQGGHRQRHNAVRKGRPARSTSSPSCPATATRSRATRPAEDALQAHPDLAGIFAINDPSAPGRPRRTGEAPARPTQVKIIGFDGQPEGKQAIREGKIYADPIQYPDQIGRKTAQAIVDYFNGKTPEREILIPTHLYRHADAEK